MDKGQLLTYIEDKGNSRKGAMHKITQLQTNDWHDTADQKKKMVEQVNRLRQEQQEWLQQVQQQSVDAQNEQQQIGQIEQTVQ